MTIRRRGHWGAALAAAAADRERIAQMNAELGGARAAKAARLGIEGETDPTPKTERGSRRLPASTKSIMSLLLD
jgi:hypothetical protein